MDDGGIFSLEVSRVVSSVGSCVAFAGDTPSGVPGSRDVLQREGVVRDDRMALG